MSKLEHLISVKTTGITEAEQQLSKMSVTAENAGKSVKKGFDDTVPAIDSHANATKKAGKETNKLTEYINGERQAQRQSNFLFREGIGVVSAFGNSNKQLSNIMVNAYGNMQAVDFALGGISTAAENAGGKFGKMGAALTAFVGPISIAVAVFGGLAYLINSTIDSTKEFNKQLHELKIKSGDIGLAQQLHEANIELEKIKNSSWTDEYIEKITYIGAAFAASGGHIGKFLDTLMTLNKEAEKTVDIEKQSQKIKDLTIKMFAETEALDKAYKSLFTFKFNNLQGVDSVVAAGKTIISTIDAMIVNKEAEWQSTVKNRGTTFIGKEMMENQLAIEMLRKERTEIREKIKYLSELEGSWKKASEEVWKYAQVNLLLEKQFSRSGFIRRNRETPEDYNARTISQFAKQQQQRDAANAQGVGRIGSNTPAGRGGRPSAEQISKMDNKWKDMGKSMEESADIGFNAFSLAFNGINSGIDNMITGMIDGTMSLGEAFGEMTKKILGDITAMIIKTLIWKGIMVLTGGLGGLIPMDIIPKAHSGMYIGGNGQLSSDEVPIIAQTGERILSRRQNKEYEANRNGSNMNISIKLDKDATDLFSSPTDRRKLKEALLESIRRGK